MNRQQSAITIGHLLGVFLAVSGLALLQSGLSAIGCYVLACSAFHTYEMRRV